MRRLARRPHVVAGDVDHQRRVRAGRRAVVDGDQAADGPRVRDARVLPVADAVGRPRRERVLAVGEAGVVDRARGRPPDAPESRLHSKPATVEPPSSVAASVNRAWRSGVRAAGLAVIVVVGAVRSTVQVLAAGDCRRCRRRRPRGPGTCARRRRDRRTARTRPTCRGRGCTRSPRSWCHRPRRRCRRTRPSARPSRGRARRRSSCRARRCRRSTRRRPACRQALPAASTARTSSVCSPSARSVYSRAQASHECAVEAALEAGDVRAAERVAAVRERRGRTTT